MNETYITIDEAMNRLVMDVMTFDGKYISDPVVALIFDISEDVKSSEDRLDQQWILQTMTRARSLNLSAHQAIYRHENDGAGCRRCNADRKVTEYIIRVCAVALDEGIERKIEALIHDALGYFA